MTDTCTIKRQTGTTTDPNTGAVTPTYADVYGSAAKPGKCRVKTATNVPTERAVGEQYVVLAQLQLSIPMSATGVRGGDVVTIVASQFDPDLPGRTFTIGERYGQSQATARRFAIEDPEGSA